MRIGILITDSTTLVYSPTPYLIEAGSTQEDKPNAIVIPVAAEVIEQACATATGTLPEDAEIGRSVVKAEELAAMKKDLEETPPKQFNIARIERVFNSKIQYVEFKVTNYRLSKKIAAIPAYLMGIADDPDIQNRWRHAFRMFSGSEKLTVQIPVYNENGNIQKTESGVVVLASYNETTLESDRKQIEKRYLIKVPNYDVVILRANRSKFDNEVAAFKKKLKEYQDALEAKVKSSIEETTGKLVDILLPHAKKKIPERYLKVIVDHGSISDDELREIMLDDLKQHFGEIKDIASPEVKVKYKDISYETIHDNGFREALKKAKIPKGQLEKLFSEYDAAPEDGQQQLNL